MQQNTFLYHSFPRRWRHDAAKEKDVGILILRLLLKSGILCVPESLDVYPEYKGDTRVSKLKIPVHQNRFCLTLLSEVELLGHARHFGRFSVAFSTHNARILGAVPVIYVPIRKERPAPEGSDLIGHTLLRRLIEIQYLLTDLATASGRMGNKPFLLVNDMSDQQRRAIYEFINSLSHSIEPVEDLTAAIRAVLKLFYPTERGTLADAAADELAYYYQREWRIIEGTTVFDIPTDGPLTPEEQQILVDLDPEFFAHRARYGNQEGRRVDLCRFVRSAGSRSVSELIDHITVAENFKTDALKVASECGFNGDIRVLPPEH